MSRVNLHTTTRSAFLAACEAPMGLGIRPIERAHIMEGAPLTLTDFEYKLSFFQHARIGAFNPVFSRPPHAKNLAKYILFEGDVFELGFPDRYSADIVEVIDETPIWVGFVWGDEIWVDLTRTVNDRHPLMAKTGADLFEWNFNPVLLWYELVIGPPESLRAMATPRRKRSRT